MLKKMSNKKSKIFKFSMGKKAEATLLDTVSSILLWIILFAILMGFALYYLFKKLGVW